ncbi:chemotaxis protein CheD [Clostridium acetobutylicum]|uniref:Probable chemoreceptor glutamine deamidase CheD n=1 Tax=Clostridium acetobutylicum (strain ATCC 824 / DSM 792 / JCM 1419 / IAM 19013 / LMG 5710 / NBRC 13948 / NRRL B-527 / VKM B-1787 / 2291 / W) TaxID=272562 RepID=CHED_CLOAB|nr:MULTISPECIES: chemoreceptor glutamine deamidase CheD [Clostridium]Q97GZ2.1 RecName: Full=Probable chemoreceptor glutamine deamidase CheD [Clostridium acetobutylicum ATCC 824]AAK80180.1 Chemotaxis protein CheD [Clostridium acetobutylicum ATCC 824]ADZ21274.1 Chemotaxis protein CheD [Clostridium acetobutylicum EA 2018]AEI33177.1 chemoreceptor glutamine deamidase CheD [Clostridium acetobutylicum DSM 1731]AWV79394.1 chemoreceptor glutamine deamidase CheD [Clostridium acetobutylicum]MBC2394634.1
MEERENIKEIRVGIADLNTAFSPNRIITVGLGSCIGIAIYDSKNKLGGLSHIMLPDSTQFSKVTNPYKFADLAIPILIKKMEGMGANIRNMKAKIAGGASMFNFSDKNMNMDIGNRNGISVKKVLKELNVPLLSQDIGGNKGRTMIFNTLDGSVDIRTVGMGIRKI